METSTEAPIAPARRITFLALITRFFALIGILAVVYVVSGLAVDISEFDPTTGGYEYPYTDWVGTPIDYTQMYITDEGMFKRGRVIDLYFNCNTGMIRYSVLGIFRGDFREFSARAKAVHQPQVTCRAIGFDTSAWDG